MFGVLRAKEEKASEAAPRMLPRLRVGGLAGGLVGGDASIGDMGGDGRSANDVEGDVVVAIDCAVRGRLMDLRVTVAFGDKVVSIGGKGDEVVGEYVTKDADAVAVGCTANGSATSMR